MQNDAGTRAQKWHKTDTSGSPPVPPSAQKKTAAISAKDHGGHTDRKTFSGQKTIEAAGEKQADNATQIAVWVKEKRRAGLPSTVAAIKAEFGVTALQACEALALANATGGCDV